MTTIAQSFKSITIYGLDALIKIRFVLIGILIIGLGIFLGYQIDSSEAGELIISIMVVLILLIVTINKPLNGLLLLLFFMAFAESWIEIPMGAGIPDLSFSRFAIIFLGIFMLAQAAIGKFRFAQIGWTEVFILGTVIGIMSAAPFSIQPKPIGVIQNTLSLQFTPLVMYFFAKNLIKNKDDLHKLFWVIVLFGFVAGTYTIYESATGNVLFRAKESKELGEWNLVRGDTGIRQIRGLMGSTGKMGRILAATIPLTFYLLLETKKTDLLRKIMLAGMLAIQFCGIVLTYARSPWYALLIALFMMQFFYPQFRKLFFVIAFAALLVVWATWDQVSESQAANRVNDEVSTLEGREARWNAGFNMWKSKPIRGWGFGRFAEVAGRFRTDGDRRNFRNGAIENDYLYIAVNTGLIGLGPYILFLLVPLLNSLRLFFKAYAPDWQGFIKPGTISIYWAVLICLVFTSYSAIHSGPVIKMVTFAVVGAVVGSHEYLLRRPKTGTQRQTGLYL